MTTKQKIFVEAYLGQANFCAAEAARIAGYNSPKQRGYEVRHLPEVQAAIEVRIAEETLAANEVLHRLSDQARGAGQFISVPSRGLAYVDLEAMEEAGKKHLVKSLKYTEKGQQILEFYDAQNALIQIGRHHKLFTDKSESTSTVHLNVYDDLSNEELDARIAEAESGEVAPPAPEEPGSLRTADPTG